jgi:predicted nucleic acid-binding protein
MSDEARRQGLLDTNILILRKWINPAELPEEMTISAVTLAELSAGPHEVRRNDEQDMYEERAERARRLEILQRVESSSTQCRSTLRPRASTGASLPPLSLRRTASREVGQLTS